MSIQERIDYINAWLPDWTIQAYGRTGAIVCYPDRGWNTDSANQDLLRDHAVIVGIVSGNGIVISKLPSEPIGCGVHPLAIW